MGALYSINNKKYQQGHASSGTRHDIDSPSRPYFYHLCEPHKSRYDTSFCLRRNNQDIEIDVQKTVEFTNTKVSYSETGYSTSCYA